MTQSPTPVQALTPNTPLTAGDVELLREGDWLHTTSPAVKTKRGLRLPRAEAVQIKRVTATHLKFTNGAGYLLTNDLSTYTFLGHPDQDGWIKRAPDTTSVSGLRTDLRFEDGHILNWMLGDQITGEMLAHGQITHWRPHVPSQAPSAHPEPASQGREALTIDALAQEIRRVDGNHDLGAGALAERLLPFIQAALASPAQDEPLGVDLDATVDRLKAGLERDRWCDGTTVEHRDLRALIAEIERRGRK